MTARKQPRSAQRPPSRRGERRRWFASTAAGVRAPLVLLAAMLFASLTIAAFTVRLLGTQAAALREAVTESESHALALLATRLEQALLGRLRPPFQVLKSTAGGEAAEGTLAVAASSSPYVTRVMILDGESRLRASWAREVPPADPRVEEWLSRAAAAEIRKLGADSFGTFVDHLPDGPVLLALQPLSEVGPEAGWILVTLDLPALLGEVADPLLADFMGSRGGRVELQDSEDRWDEEALHEPLSPVLPGWLLFYRPDPRREQGALEHGRRLLLAVSGGAVLALLLATFAAWRELHRERALAELRNRFVASVSHELKTPLSLIRVYAETLTLNRIKEPGRRHAYLETIVREAEHLTDMIDNVLDLERLRCRQELYRLTANDLARTVKEALERYRETLAWRGAVIDFDLDPSLPPVAHDPQGVTRILLNLINNALDHGGGDTIHVSLRDEGDSVDLAVTDGGTGLTSEELGAIRRAIARGEAAPSHRGSGLGLALVERVAAAHRAYLLLERPAGGGGLRVIVSFPVHRAGVDP